MQGRLRRERSRTATRTRVVGRDEPSRRGEGAAEVGAGALEQHLRAGGRRRGVARGLHVRRTRPPARRRRAALAASWTALTASAWAGRRSTGTSSPDNRDCTAKTVRSMRARRLSSGPASALMSSSDDCRRAKSASGAFEAFAYRSSAAGLHRPLVSREAQPLCRVQSFFEDEQQARTTSGRAPPRRSSAARTRAIAFSTALTSPRSAARRVRFSSRDCRPE